MMAHLQWNLEHKTVFPIITSCHRALKQPQKAIDFWMENKRIFVSCLSVPLLTSLAAAYCDVGNYDLAKRYTYSDKKEALKYINLAIEEVHGDVESYFLYKRRAKIKEGLGDHLGAKEDLEQYEKMKAKVDIRRVHALKHQAEQEDSAFAYYHLAYAYEQIKDYDNAIWAINKAIERTDLNNQYKRYRTELVKVHEIH